MRLVRGRIAEPPEAGADVGAPDFRLGIASIAVDPATHRLTPTITTSRKDYRPGEDVDADVFVKGHDGKPGRGEVTFYAVDEGVLMLTSYQTPDPLPAFSASRKLAVFAIESREDLAHIIPMKNGEHIRPLGYEYLNPTGGDKGADGGGGGDGTRLDFKTTAFFDAGKVTDQEGHVRYHFKLPDNLTTFRLMAIVAGADDRFGAGEATIVTSKRLMARPVMPRIVRVGDRFEAGVIVSSKDLPATTARVTVAAEGADLRGARDARRLGAGRGNVEVRFPFLAIAAGPASFTFTAEATGDRDDVQRRAPRRPAALDRDGVDLRRDHERGRRQAWRPLPAAARPGRARGAPRVDGAGRARDQLRPPRRLSVRLHRAAHQPHPAASRAPGPGARGRRTPTGARRGRRRRRDRQAARPPGRPGRLQLLGRRRARRAVAVGVRDAAVEGAAQRGMFVPKEARDRGVSYLRQVLDQSVPAEDADEARQDPEADDHPGEALAPARSPKEKRALLYGDLVFVADALATLGQADPATLGRLFDARAHRPLFSQALLLHAMATAHLPASELETLVGEIVPRVRVDAADAYADEVAPGFEDFLDSSTRTSALVLRALLAAHPDHPLASRLAHGLLARREGGAWRSTQENVWALIALDDYRKAQEAAQPDFDARVFLGGTRLGEAHFHGGLSVDQPVSTDMRQLVAHAGGPLTFDLVGQGKLYYSAELTSASAVLPVKPRDGGLYVQKLLRALKPSELAAAQKVLPQHGESKAAPGDLVLIDLLLESAEPREQVVIADPLPAGLEPIDFALETSAQGERVMDDGPRGDERHRALFQYGVAFGTPARRTASSTTTRCSRSCRTSTRASITSAT